MRRTLTLFDVVCIGLNAIVGSGIFLLPDDLYRQMGVLSPLAFLLCAVGLLPIALCYAEAASSVDRTGGPYVYASEAFGAKVGFGVGWMCFANAVFSFAAVASAAGAYFGRLVPAFAGLWPERFVALVVIAIFGALNYRGAKPGALAVDAFTLAKFGVLIVLVAALVPEVSWPSGPAATTLPQGLSGVGAATFVALFAAQGFEVVPVPAGETRHPRRDIPIGIVGSLLLASLLYVVVQAVLVGAYARLGHTSDTPIADAALAVVPTLGTFIAIGGLISMLGFVSGSALGTPRYLYAAASDGHLHAALGRVHVVHQSPHVAVVVTCAISAAMASALDYRALIGMSNVAVAVQYLATCLAIPVLRRRGGERPGFKVPFGPVIPLVGAVLSVWVFTQATLEELTWAAASMIVGVVALVAGRRSASAGRA
jgi:APA family basic amino acid/polyamine antiporter